MPGLHCADNALLAIALLLQPRMETGRNFPVHILQGAETSVSAWTGHAVGMTDALSMAESCTRGQRILLNPT